MRRPVHWLISTALAVLVCSAAIGCSRVVNHESPAKPNIVFILADDMRYDDLKYMPKTRFLLGDGGMRFNHAYVSNALCCPSRATIMRGQYAHNTGVWTNINGTDGGWKGYRYNGDEQDNLATRLHAAGYKTALLGKYLNDYRNTTVVPPGWDKWFAVFEPPVEYFNYDVNSNGQLRHFGTGESDYLTDVLSRQTQQFISASVAQGKPFFAYVAPPAPHHPLTPAPRDEHTYDGLKAPRPPSFNEADVSDKPPWIRQLPRLSDRAKAEVNGRFEKRLETLQALDNLVEGVVNTLWDSGQLNNTYIVFTSDNGVFRGEHRLPAGKAEPYEEDVRVPLLIRGPDVQAGSTTNKLVLNTDYFPTFTDLAGIRTPSYVDGRSLKPILKGATPSTWRTAILLEYRHTREGGQTPSYYGIRTSDGMKYIEYKGGFRELYNLNRDPYELANSYDATAPPKSLGKRLAALKSCSGDSCRAAENGP